MFKLERLSSLLSETSVGLRAIVFLVTVLGMLVAGAASAKAILSMPGKLDKHSADTMTQTEVMKKMLCIQVADHRKLDWTLCYINPDVVLPESP